MTVEVRTPDESRREEIARLLSASLNSPLERSLRRAPKLPLPDFRCTFEDGRVVATAAEYRFDQWFGGNAIPCSGIFAVATLPERRTSGFASAAVERLLREARDRGDPVTALYPAVLRPYRRLGYGWAGTYTDHRLLLDDIPADDSADLPAVEELDVERDLEGVRACYREYVRPHNGPVEPTTDAWWTERAFDPSDRDAFRAVVVRVAGGVEAYAGFERSSTEGPLDVSFGLECSAFAWTTERALRALLAYFRGYRGLGRWVEWVGPPNDPIALLLPEQKLATPFVYRWMLRLLDVPAAFAARGYPPVDGACTIAVEDPMFPENAGPFRIEARGGKAAVEPATSAAGSPISIDMLSSMFSGYLSAVDAARLGYLDANDPAIEVLSRLLTGPAPWSPIFF